MTDSTGFRPFCIVAIIIAFALVPIALTRAEAPTHMGASARISLRELYRQSPLGLVAASLCGVTASAFFTLGPIFAQERGLDTGGVAAFMASGTLGAFLLAWPLGWLSDRLDRRLVIIGAAVTAALTLVAMMALIPNRAVEPLGKRLEGRLDLNAEQTRCSDVSRVCEKCRLGQDTN